MEQGILNKNNKSERDYRKINLDINLHLTQYTTLFSQPLEVNRYRKPIKGEKLCKIYNELKINEIKGLEKIRSVF